MDLNERREFLWNRVVVERGNVAEAAAAVGISRERARQIIVKAAKNLGYKTGPHGRNSIAEIRSMEACSGLLFGGAESV